MNAVITRIDIPRTRASWPDTVFSPAYVMSRKQGDTTDWLVADSPVPDDGRAAISWASARNDEYVRIPLFEYRLQPQGDMALMSVFKLGVIAANLAPALIKKMYVVIGNPVELIQDAEQNVISMSYWLGFAISAED